MYCSAIELTRKPRNLKLEFGQVLTFGPNLTGFFQILVGAEIFSSDANPKKISKKSTLAVLWYIDYMQIYAVKYECKCNKTINQKNAL